MAACQADRLGGQHQPHDRRRQWLASAYAVRQHQVALQFGQLMAGNPRAGQLAEAGVDAVDHLVVVDDVLHRRQRCVHAGAHRRVKRQANAARLNAAQHGEVNLAGREHELGRGRRVG